MPRVTSIEEKLLTTRLESLQRTTTFQSGLVVAQVGSKADTVLLLAPTPEQEGAKPGVLDVDWMLEHAAQVARMLPGGVAVLGCYLFAPGTKLTKSEATLCLLYTSDAAAICSV